MNRKETETAKQLVILFCLISSTALRSSTRTKNQEHALLVKHVDLQQCVPDSDQPHKRLSEPHLSANWVTVYKKQLMLSNHEQNPKHF